MSGYYWVRGGLGIHDGMSWKMEMRSLNIFSMILKSLVMQRKENPWLGRWMD